METLSRCRPVGPSTGGQSDVLLPGRDQQRGGGALVSQGRHNGHRTAGDLVPFFRAWMEDPKRVASVTPSGRALAELITREISPQSGVVLELGPGTGVFTRALLARGVRESDLTLVEFGEEFADLLQSRFPQARVICMDAARLGRIDLFDGRQLGAVVSGLPLLSMSPRKVIGILCGAFAHLRDGGAFYQFTYSPRCPIPRRVLDRLGLNAVRVGIALFNVPPAIVYRISRRTPLALSATAA